jgi:uncharacterized protein YbjT (DUF2867 family)
MKTILVTGATGQQGGAVTKHLLKNNWKVRAFVRDEKKPASIELKQSGVEVYQGDMIDEKSLEKAMAGVYGVFSVQNYWEHGYEGELNQGLAVANAASKAGVQHFVQSSVGGAERGTKLPHFDVKFEIENHIKKIKIPATIIRPVFFMENFNTFSAPVESEGKLTLTMAMKLNTKLQIIAVDDIGAITAIIFNDPANYLGKEIEIAGDELTMPQVAAAFAKGTGKETSFNELPMDILRSNNEEFANMFQWFIDKGYRADIPELRKIHPGLISFETWVKNNK